MTIQPYEPQPTQMLDRATDSWTAVLVPVVDLAGNIASTEFVPKDMRGNPAKVAAAILHGRELGLPPMTALAGIHVINGRPGISSELMRALILQAGHDVRVVETSVARCKMRGRRKGEDEWTEVSYTMEEAKASGDFQKNPNYRTRGADMLVARCSSRLARLAFADVIHGLRSLEELEDLAEAVVDGPVAAIAPVSDTATVQRAPRAKAAPAPAPEPEQDAPAPRRRPELPRRGGVRTPQGDQPTAPLVADENGEIVDAEVVPDAAPVEEPVRVAEVKPLAARLRGAVGVLVSHFDRLGIDGRDERLEWTALLVGRELKSSNELTLAEATDAIRRVEKLADYDALVEYGQFLEDERRGVVPDGADRA